MNAQPAIEAAKIAAEAASKNAEKTLLITIIMALISLLGVLASAYISSKSAAHASKVAEDLGKQNLEALKQKRYIDAISTERVKWINEMREKSSEFLKVTHLQSNDVLKFKEDIKNKVDISKIKQDVLIERSSEIVSICNQINLLLNPTDNISHYLIMLQNDVADDLRISKVLEFNVNQLEVKILDIGYLYQVIIRSEWKRIKEENELGAELSEVRMNEIYTNIAKKLDDETYKKFFNEDKEKAPN
ncbi:hypothetical protein [Bacillus mobilis]|uniref:hypothetical protein n=1 Tax=Bacillus mobilis TaxID=2026190 RepID=UPI0036BBDAB5